jgi:hypothetical protein
MKAHTGAVLVCALISLVSLSALATPSPAPMPSAPQQPAGNVLQVQVMADWLPRHAGEMARVRILLDGRPAVGAFVWVEGAAGRSERSERADRDGVATVFMAHPGLSTIRAAMPMPSVDMRHPARPAIALGSLSIVLSLPTE